MIIATEEAIISTKPNIIFTDSASVLAAPEGESFKYLVHTDPGRAFSLNKHNLLLDSRPLKNQKLMKSQTRQQIIVANRTMDNTTAYSELTESNMDKVFWGGAITTANYVHSRLPSSSLESTRYKIWHGKNPSYVHFWVFGPDVLYTFAKKNGVHERRLRGQ